MFEKRRYQKFLTFVNDYDENDPKTHKGMCVSVCYWKLGSIQYHSLV